MGSSYFLENDFCPKLFSCPLPKAPYLMLRWPIMPNEDMVGVAETLTGSVSILNSVTFSFKGEPFSLSACGVVRFSVGENYFCIGLIAENSPYLLNGFI